MKTETKRLWVGWTMAVLLLAVVGTLHAHHSLAPFFDLETLVQIDGTIVRFDPVNPHSYLYVDRTSAEGQVERWALEGPAAFQFDRRGISRDLFKTGDTIKACGLGLKADSPGPRGVDGRVMVAMTLRMANGEGRIWADYGQAHRCVALDQKTHYTR